MSESVFQITRFLSRYGTRAPSPFASGTATGRPVARPMARASRAVTGVTRMLLSSLSLRRAVSPMKSVCLVAGQPNGRSAIPLSPPGANPGALTGRQ